MTQILFRDLKCMADKDVTVTLELSNGRWAFHLWNFQTVADCSRDLKVDQRWGTKHNPNQ
jgi:hypothetical protein